MANGVYQLKLPVPLPLRFVSVYLVEGDDGWTLVDAGFHYPPTYEVWASGAAAVGCDLERDVARIVVTHFHPDHLGGARWLQERSGAPVCMMDEEISLSQQVWGGTDAPGRLFDFLVSNGMPRAMAGSGADAMRHKLPLPESLSVLRPGDKIPVGAGVARILHTPGHADHQLVLHDEERGILFAADQVLLVITPNIGIWPESEPHPLARYLDSLNDLRALNVGTVLPGHGPVFHDLPGRVDELVAHHAERLDAMRATLAAGPKTPYEVSRSAFRGTLTIHQRCFALAETLAHLEQLVLEGRATRSDDECVAYGIP